MHSIHYAGNGDGTAKVPSVERVTRASELVHVRQVREAVASLSVGTLLVWRGWGWGFLGLNGWGGGCGEGRRGNEFDDKGGFRTELRRA